MGIAVTSGLALLFFVLFFCQCRKSREGTLFYMHHNHLSISMILRFFDCITRHLPYFLFVKWMFHLTDFHFWLNFVFIPFWRKGNRDHYNTTHETTGYLDVQHLERPVVHAHAGNGEINLYPYQTRDTWITWFFSRNNSMLELFSEFRNVYICMNNVIVSCKKFIFWKLYTQCHVIVTYKIRYFFRIIHFVKFSLLLCS